MKLAGRCSNHSIISSAAAYNYSSADRTFLAIRSEHQLPMPIVYAWTYRISPLGANSRADRSCDWCGLQAIHSLLTIGPLVAPPAKPV